MMKERVWVFGFLSLGICLVVRLGVENNIKTSSLMTDRGWRLNLAAWLVRESGGRCSFSNTWQIHFEVLAWKAKKETVKLKPGVTDPEQQSVDLRLSLWCRTFTSSLCTKCLGEAGAQVGFSTISSLQTLPPRHSRS